MLRLNEAQRRWAWWAAISLILMFLFPPWAHFSTGGSEKQGVYVSIGPQEEFAGYELFIGTKFLREIWHGLDSSYTASRSCDQWDFKRLGFQIVGWALFFGLAIWMNDVPYLPKSQHPLNHPEGAADSNQPAISNKSDPGKSA